MIARDAIVKRALHLVLGREVGVAALRRARDVACAVPDERRLTEAGARRDHRHVRALLLRQPCLDALQLRRRHVEGPEALGHEIVQERDPRAAEAARDLLGVDGPREVRRLHPLPDDGARDAEARGDDPLLRRARDELGERVFEGAERAALEDVMVDDLPRLALAELDEGETRAGPPDVTTEDEAHGVAFPGSDSVDSTSSAAMPSPTPTRRLGVSGSRKRNGARMAEIVTPPPITIVPVAATGPPRRSA